MQGFLLQVRNPVSGQWQTAKFLKTDRKFDESITTLVNNEYYNLTTAHQWVRQYDQPSWSECRIVALNIGEESSAESVELRVIPSETILAKIDTAQNHPYQRKRNRADDNVNLWRELVTAAGNARPDQVCPTCGSRQQ